MALLRLHVAVTPLCPLSLTATYASLSSRCARCPPPSKRFTSTGDSPPDNPSLMPSTADSPITSRLPRQTPPYAEDYRIKHRRWREYGTVMPHKYHKWNPFSNHVSKRGSLVRPIAP